MLTISQTHLREMRKHGEEAYPEECCGAMLGEVDKQEKITRLLVPIENQWQDKPGESRHRRFAISADDYQYLEQKAADANLTLLGFYHTHPDHPARPSQTDLNYAWPFFSYIILSVEKSQAKEILSYELSPEKREFCSEELRMIDY